MDTWNVKESHYLLRRPWMNVRVDEVRLPDGTPIDEFHVVEEPDWAGVVCLAETGELLMVEQYRHGTERLSLELPVGAIHAGEDPLAAAQRELLEETGYEAEDWTPLLCCAAEPNRHTNYAHFFAARGGRRVQPADLDPTENLAARLVSPAEALRRAGQSNGCAASGEATLLHGLHRLALLMAERGGWL